jgi:putative ABC transport system permease protein
VVGVLQEGFSFTFVAADVFVPLTESAAGSPRDRRDLVSIARMAPGVTTDQVRAEVSDIATALATEYAEVQRDWTIDVFNARYDIPDTRTKIFYALLQGSVFFVLLIACANIANLLLARAQERQREIALRTVLGAGRRRLIRQLLTESGMLVVGGSTLGLALGWVGIRALASHFAGMLPANYTPTLDGSVVLFTAGLSVLAGLIFGLAPIGQTLQASQAQVLKEGGGKSSAGRSRKLVSRALVVAEIALSLVALGGGAMLVRSFVELQTADPGFDGSGLLTARLRVPASRYPGEEERLALYDRLLERAAGIEGVRNVAIVNALPRNFQIPTDTFRLAGAPRDEAVALPRAFVIRTSPGYVDAFGIELLQGRFFESGDRPGAAPVAVVNRSFAERWSPDQDAVGRFVDFDGASRQIVGVVEDVQQLLFPTPGQVESDAIFVPAAQSPMGAYTVVISGDVDPASLKEPLRTSVQSMDPDLALSAVFTMDEVVEQFFAGVDVFNTILGGFGLLGILLASLGTYGVLAYQVSQRRHEIGIRMAIGARGREVVTMVTKQGVVMAVLGLALGGIVLVPLTRLLRSLLQGFATVDATTSVGVALVLLAVTVLASLVPAVRASGLDPVRALRDE